MVLTVTEVCIFKLLHILLYSIYIIYWKNGEVGEVTKKSRGIYHCSNRESRLMKFNQFINP